MMKKQKIMLYRIIAAAVIYVPLFVLEHMGKLEFQSEIPVQFLLFMIPYLIVGWDIIYRAVRNISHGQVFDENFLMCIATFGALGVKEYSEAVAVMLFYQIGELFQSYAVNRSRQSISAMMDICPEYANIEEDGKLKQVDPDDVEIGYRDRHQSRRGSSSRWCGCIGNILCRYFCTDRRVGSARSNRRFRDYQRLCKWKRTS